MTGLNDYDIVRFDITTKEAGISTGESFPGLANDGAGNTWFRIILNSALPLINFASSIEVKGSTQTREAVNAKGPEVELRSADGSNYSCIMIGSNSRKNTIEGLAINNYTDPSYPSITVNGGVNAGYNTIRGCYIGTTPSGDGAYPNDTGISIYNASTGNIIGGNIAAHRNIISGNNLGLYISGSNSNEVKGNIVGLDRTGTVIISGSQIGIYVNGCLNSTIGGASSDARNIISGNNIGIKLRGETSSYIKGNYIGADISGTANKGNNSHGIYITWTSVSNIIGGTLEGERNIISGNGTLTTDAGVWIDTGCDSNEVIGNYIGLDVSGTARLTNSGAGIYIGGDYNIIGGTMASRGNVVTNGTLFANYNRNIDISGDSNKVRGNYIGTDKNGAVAIGKPIWGSVLITGKNNLIGGVTSDARNVIAYSLNISGANASGNEIKGNYVGLNAAGDAVLSNGGVYISDANSNTIGGLTAGERNIIAGNGSGNGVELRTANSNEVIGNYIGLSPSGESRFSFDVGVSINSASKYNKIGKAVAGAGNVISGNINNIGIGGSGTNSNEVLGNYIGLTASGEGCFVNTSMYGVGIGDRSSYNKIGDGTAAGRNIISGHRDPVSNDHYAIAIDSGVGLGFKSVGNIIKGNYIGTNKDGTKAIPNDNGIFIKDDCQDNVIGGENGGDGNVISAQIEEGIRLFGENNYNNYIKGNYIGLKANGIDALGNSTGIRIEYGSHDNVIGGTTSAEGNVISGNSNEGILINYSSGVYSHDNDILGNFIGTRADGLAALSNQYGIFIEDGMYSNRIGNGGVNGRNVISGNSVAGIVIQGPGTNSNEVSGNCIGTDLSGNISIPNPIGVNIRSGSKYNKVGRGDETFVNLIANNTTAGVVVNNSTSESNLISKNSFYNNGIAISLLNGANKNISAPAVSNAYINELVQLLTIEGTASGSNSVEVYKAQGGQGKTWISNAKASGGNWSVTLNSSGYVSGDTIVAVQRDANNNTSQFSASRAVVVTVPITYRPDNMVGLLSNGSDYKTEGTWETTPVIQVHNTSLLPNAKATVYFKLKNAGNVNDSFRVTGDASGGSFEVKYYDSKTSTVEITNTVTSGAVMSTVFTPGASREIRAEITYSGYTLATKEVKLTIGSTNEAGKIDAVKVVITFNAFTYRPDNMVGTVSHDPDYHVLGMYEDVPVWQIKDVIYKVDNVVTAYYKVLNAGNGADSFRVSGEASAGNYTINYTILEPVFGDITDIVTSDGVLPLSFAPGASAEIKAEISYSGTTYTTKDVFFTLTSTNDADKRDVVKTLIRFMPYNYRPDNMVGLQSNGLDYLTNGIWEDTPTTQVRNKSLAANTKATVYFKFLNAGNGTEQYRVSGDASSGSFEVKYYDAKFGGNVITDLVTMGAVAPIVFSPNVSTEIRAEITYSGLTLATKEVKVILSSTKEGTIKDAVKAVVTFEEIFFRPDNMVGLLSDGSDYRWEGTVESPPATQVQSKEVLINQKATVFFKLKNAGNNTDSFRITGDASSANFIVKYYDSKTGTNEITNTVTSGAVAPAISAGGSTEIRAEVSYSGSTIATKEITLTIGSTNDANKKDAVKAVITFVPFAYQPDGMVGSLLNGSDYKTEGVYETTPVLQVQSKSVATNETAVFYLKVKNAGNTTDSFIASGEGSSGSFTVKYFDSKTGTNDVTGSIVPTHAPSPPVTSGASLELRVEVSNNGTALATKEILVTFTSSADGSRNDTVKAVITFVPLVSPPPAGLDHFMVSAPTTAVSSTAFSVTVTAKNSAGATLTGTMTGTTLITVDSGSVSPASIDPSAFISGVWTGSITLNRPGKRIITVSNGTKAGSTTITITCASKEVSFPAIPGVSVLIPAGAASSDVTVSAEVVTTSPGAPPVGFSAGGKVYSFTGSVSTFLTPVTITIPLDPGLKAPEVRYWDGSRWSSDGITVVSYTSTSITFTTTHFTLFAPMGALATNLVRFGPNPYNPNSGTNAQIWYNLDASADTSIYIIDLGGTVVWKQNYLSGAAGGSLGTNNIAYNGRTSGGDILGNGTYLYKIIQGGRSIGGGKIAIIK